MRRPPLLFALLLGCACASLPDPQPMARFAWPAGDVRLELERIVTHQPPSALNRWIGAGDEEQPHLRRPYGVAWDGDDLLIADPDANRVFRASANGALRRSALLESPTGVAVCGAEVVVTESRSGRVIALRRDLRIARVIAENLVRPTGVACDGGILYVVETGIHRVVVIDGRGARRVMGTRGGGAGQFNFPAALAVSGGLAYVGDTLNFRVQRVAVEGGGSAMFGALGDGAGDTPRVKGIAVDAHGVWVSDAHLDHISLFDSTGRFLAAIGTSGRQPGEFSFPAGLAVSAAGRLAVADSFNARVQIFRIVPEERR